MGNKGRYFIAVENGIALMKPEYIQMSFYKGDVVEIIEINDLNFIFKNNLGTEMFMPRDKFLQKFNEKD